MSARRHVAAILVVASAMLWAPAAGVARKSPSPMIDKINKARKAHGIHRARYSRSLSASSSAFSRHLALTQQFAHRSRIMASNRFSALGEVLALTRGWKVRRQNTLRYWLSSPGHRAVLLSPAFAYVGAARVPGYLAGQPVIFWTVQFGR